MSQVHRQIDILSYLKGRHTQSFGILALELAKPVKMTRRTVGESSETESLKSVVSIRNLTKTQAAVLVNSPDLKQVTFSSDLCTRYHVLGIY